MNIVDLRKLCGNKIGLPANFDGSAGAYGNLTATQQATLSICMADYILANQNLFSATQITIAQSVKRQQANGNIFPTNYSGWDMATDFVSTYVETIGDVAGDALATVSEATGLKRAVALAAVAAVVWFGAPYVLPKLKAAFAK